MNYKLVALVLGKLLYLLAVLLVATYIVGCLFASSPAVSVSTTGYASAWKLSEAGAFGVPVALCLIGGGLLRRLGLGAENRMGRREGYLVISLAWIIFSILGMLPFLLGGFTARIADSFFEAMSGFTTTGASVLTHLDHLPATILLWRAVSQWIGGMGILFFTLALLPAMGMNGQKLFSAEASGIKKGKLHARIGTTLRRLLAVYVLLTLCCAACLKICGMDLFDAVCHAFATTSTGGFSTHDNGFAFYDSPGIEYVEMIFMFLSSLSFASLYLLAAKRQFRQVWRDTEPRMFVAFIVCGFVVVCLALALSAGGFGQVPFRTILFQAVNMQSTTGFAYSDFSLWPPVAWIVLVAMAVIGGCSGSTSGGMKCIRAIVAYKQVANEFRRILHPNAVLPMRFGGSVLGVDVTRTFFSFLILWGLSWLVGGLILTLFHLPTGDCFALALSTISNTGPAVGQTIGPMSSWDTLPQGALWLLSFLMLAGRLEIFSLLLPLVPSFWKDN